MTHTLIIICIIIFAGILGGLTNFLLLYQSTYNGKECWINFFKSILLGLCASITVPLFLQIIQTSLLEVQRDVPFPNKNYFVLLGFCVLAAIYSKQFLKSLYSKVEALDSKVAKAQQKAEEAKSKAVENEKEIKNTKAELFNNEEANATKDIETPIRNFTGLNTNKRGYANRNSTMLAVATGMTFNDNLINNIYYDPALRTHGYDFKFIGLYKSWRIRAVGEVKKIVYCDYDDEEDILIPNRDINGNVEIFNSLTKDELMKIKNVIVNTRYYDLRTGIKFFLIDKFYETDYLLDSPIMGKQYFWLNEFLGFEENMSSEQLARMLSDLNLERINY